MKPMKNKDHPKPEKVKGVRKLLTVFEDGSVAKVQDVAGLEVEITIDGVGAPVEKLELTDKLERELKGKPLHKVIFDRADKDKPIKIKPEKPKPPVIEPPTPEEPPKPPKGEKPDKEPPMS